MKTANEAIAAMKAELERRKNAAIIDMASSDIEVVKKGMTREKMLRGLSSFLDTLEAENAPSCRSCGFYENNCPYIRGKFIPYPNKVCNYYTDGEMKAVEKKVDLEKDIDEYIEGCLGSLEGREIASCARYFYNLGLNGKK